MPFSTEQTVDELRDAFVPFEFKLDHAPTGEIGELRLVEYIEDEPYIRMK